MNVQRIILSLWAFFFFALLFPHPLPAQITFERTYGGSNWDEGYSVQQTLDGGYIIAGVTVSYGVYVIKTDAFGDTLWTRNFGDTTTINEREEGQSVLENFGGGFIIAGWKGGFDCFDPRDVLLINTNSLGDTFWTRTYSGGNYDEGYSVQSASGGSDGGIIIAGSTGPACNNSDVYLIKTDSLGDTLWTRTYDFPSSNDAFSIQETQDGGYIVAGIIWFFSGNGNALLMKTDSTGNLLWFRDYGDTLHEEAHSVVETSDGGFVFTGSTTSYGAGGNDVWLVKTDSSGNILWSKTFGGIGGDYGYSVQKTSDGGYIITGRTSSYGAGLWDVYLIKTNSLGDTLWTRTFGGISLDKGESVQETSDGGFIIAGMTMSFGSGWQDVYLIKTDSLGNVLVGIEEEDLNKKDRDYKSTLFQNRPNPFTHSTTIHYALSVTRGHGLGIRGEGKLSVRLTIYDITGRLIEILVDENQKPGVYQVYWEGKTQASGIYFYRLNTGDFVKTRKMILLK
jgi:hypothetical protein